MNHLSRSLAVAAFDAIAAPASAQHVDTEVTLYDVPHQQDFFFQSQRGLVTDLFATGGIARPAAMPFDGAREYPRARAEDHN